MSSKKNKQNNIKSDLQSDLSFEVSEDDELIDFGMDSPSDNTDISSDLVDLGDLEDLDFTESSTSSSEDILSSDLDDFSFADDSNDNKESSNEIEEELSDEASNEIEESTQEPESPAINLQKSDTPSPTHSTSSQASTAQPDEMQEDDIELYMLMDKACIGTLTYLRDYGVKVSKVYKNIADAENDFMMAVTKVRLVVVDAGTGLFSSTKSREKLIGLSGIIDEDKKISVFYTDANIKDDIVNQKENLSINFDKEIDWHKYKSTPDLVARILRLGKKEHYAYGSDMDTEDMEKILDTDAQGNSTFLKFKGATDSQLEALLKKHEKDRIEVTLPIIKVSDVEQYILNDNPSANTLESFKIKV